MEYSPLATVAGRTVGYNDMYILGMESSCDETSAAVVEMIPQDPASATPPTRRILSNIVASQIETHRLYGGVVPEIASRAHIEAVSGITREALATAGLSLSDIDAVAVTTHPGLIGALLVGVNFAKAAALALNKSTVSRILLTLASKGYVVKNKDNYYRLGMLRAAAGFGHPVYYGAFCAVMFRPRPPDRQERITAS